MNLGVGQWMQNYAKVMFGQSCKKNFTAAGVLRINIWLFIPVPKMMFDHPLHVKHALVIIILGVS